MRTKLTISIDKEVYEGLYAVVGPRRISKFIEDLVRPHVIRPDLEAAYQQMGEDEEREAEALEWAEATFVRKRCLDEPGDKDYELFFI